MSISVNIPPNLYGQALLNQDRLSDWGVVVTIALDHTTRLVFPSTAELSWSDDTKVAVISLREDSPSPKRASWSFDANFVTEKGNSPDPKPEEFSQSYIDAAKNSFSWDDSTASQRVLYRAIRMLEAELARERAKTLAAQKQASDASWRAEYDRTMNPEQGRDGYL